MRVQYSFIIRFHASQQNLLTPVKPHLYHRLLANLYSKVEEESLRGALLASNIDNQDDLALELVEVIVLALGVKRLQVVESSSRCHCDA